jgi:hypothetical protein
LPVVSRDKYRTQHNINNIVLCCNVNQSYKDMYHVRHLTVFHKLINKIVNKYRQSGLKRRLYWIDRFYTTIYYKYRSYGGEEEGGWFYNSYEYIDHIFTPFGIGQYKAEDRLKRIHENDGSGNSIEVYFERKLKENEDTSTHYYN